MVSVGDIYITTYQCASEVRMFGVYWLSETWETLIAGLGLFGPSLVVSLISVTLSLCPCLIQNKNLLQLN